MPLDDILRKFAADLAAKGKVKSVQAAMDMNRRVRGRSACLRCVLCSRAAALTAPADLTLR
jgi:hypothetical protein